MNLYLISFGHANDSRRGRNYLADGGDQAILVRADDQSEAEEIARTCLVVVAPAVVHAHLVARVIEG
jgi:hypothetical protein